MAACLSECKVLQPVVQRILQHTSDVQHSCDVGLVVLEIITLNLSNKEELLHFVLHFPNSFCLLLETFTASWVSYIHTEISCDRFTLHLSVLPPAPNKRNMSVANPSGSSLVCK
jgi:hypothetical protein